MIMHQLKKIFEKEQLAGQLTSGIEWFDLTAPPLRLFAFIPDNVVADRVLVCVHGVSRNALEQIQLLRPYAERFGFALIAPLFEPNVFRDYQRLGRRGHGPRADLALIRGLTEIGSTTSLNTNKVAMFGFSGGAQFVHRFALAHSQRVSSMILGAAGWYTMPDTQQPYPYGIRDTKGLGATRLNVRAVSRLSTLVVAGSQDTDVNDSELNRSPRVLLHQGPHRLARARSWVEGMQGAASRHGTTADIQLRVLPGIGHSFSDAVVDGGLGEVMFDFLDQSLQGAVPETNSRFLRKTSGSQKLGGCQVIS